MQQSRISLLILAALAGGALSGLLMFDHHGVGLAESAVQGICGPEETSGCNAVSQSRYSTISGFSLGGLGLVFYSSLAFLGALALVGSESVRNAAAALGFGLVVAALATDLGLLAIQAFVIQSFCTLCLATYGVNVVAAFLLLPWASKLASIKSTLLGGEGSRAFAVWALGSLVFLVSIVSLDRALASTADAPPLLGSTILPAPEAKPESAPERESESSSEPDALSEPEPSPEPVDVPEPASEPESASPGSTTEDSDGNQAAVAALESQLEQARARITELESTLEDPEKYQEYQMAKAQAEFEQEEVQDIALEGIPFKGPDDAEVRVVEYSDFLCPYCRNLAGAFANYMPQSGGQVAIYFKNYPLDQACNPALSRTVHDGACELALGAVCAHEQDQFWPYHDRVFAQPPHNPTNEDVIQIATAAGLNADQMRSCLESPAAREKLTVQIEEAQRLEVRSTPTVFINGKRLAQIGGFLNAIQSELEN